MNGDSLGSSYRALIKALFALAEPADHAEPAEPASGFGLVLAIGPFKAGVPSPTSLPEGQIMAKGNVGDYAEVTVRAVGEIEGEIATTFDDNATGELVEISGRKYVHLLAQGATVLRSKARNPAGLELEAVSLVTSNDPADDATIIEQELGPFSPEVPV